jgi:hypothetical protein
LTLLSNLGDETVEGSPQDFAGEAVYLSQPDLPVLFSDGRMPAWCVGWFIGEGGQ